MDKTLLKGLTLLRVLAQSSAPRGVSDLAKVLGLPRSNMHRTLQTLVEAGFVAQDSQGRYACTLALFELGTAVISRVDAIAAAEPVIRDLSARTEETVHLSILDEFDVVYVKKVDSPLPVRAYSTVGGRAPAHCVATGKALLAFQSHDYLHRFAHRLVAHTRHSITDLAVLAAELNEIRQRGYAFNRGEWRESVCGLAAVIFDSDRRPVAGLGISGPKDRFSPSRLPDQSTAVMEAAAAVSKALGCSGHSVALQHQHRYPG